MRAERSHVGAIERVLQTSRVDRVTRGALTFFVASHQRARGALQRRRGQRAGAVTLLLVAGLITGSIGCESALHLDDYHFAAAGAGSLDTDNTLDSSANAGSGGASGNGGSGSGRAGSRGRNVDAGPLVDGGVDSGAGGLDAGDAGEATCGASERCVPDIPDGWQGPIAMGNGGGSCPAEYPTLAADLNAGFQEGGATCSCSCSPDGTSCHLQSETTGDDFAPVAPCSHAPTDDDCLAAVAIAPCTAHPFKQIQNDSWSSTKLACGGPSATSACAGGACYSNPSTFGDLCIASSGDVPCPDGFPNRTLYFESFTDTRDCSACTCTSQGAGCQIDLEICGQSIYSVTLHENDEKCLNSSDGETVSLISNAVTAQATCQSAGGELTGSASATNPITVCCLE
jgi:hypothetical protein